MKSLYRKLVLNTLIDAARHLLGARGELITAETLKVAVLRIFLDLIGDTHFHEYVTGWDALRYAGGHLVEDEAIDPVAATDNFGSQVLGSDQVNQEVNWVTRPWTPSEMDALNLLLGAVVPGHDPAEALKSLQDS